MVRRPRKPRDPNKPRAKRKPPVSLTAAQLLALLDLAHSTCLRDWVLILVTYWHGLRASETVNLRECDFDLAAGTVLVTRGKGSEGGYQALQVHENPLLNERAAVGWWLANRGQFGVKGAAKRRPECELKVTHTKIDAPEKTLQSTKIVKFPPETAVEAADMSNLLYPGSQKAAGGYEPLRLPAALASGLPGVGIGPSGVETVPVIEIRDSPRLFPISRVRFWQLVHGYALAVGIPKRKCKTHMLKHTIAKHLIRSGLPINEVQAWMGWSSLETANWYMMADEDELGDRIGNAIRGIGGLRQVRQGSLF
jgi:integrase